MTMKTESTARPVLESEIATWQSFVGKRKEQFAVVDADVLRRFALASGTNPDVEQNLPALSHWALFVDAVADERIGADGHPKRGDFLPDVHLPRRMFASSEMLFHSTLKLGSPARCISTITSVSHKGGRSGDLVFVKVQREVSQSDALCVTEEQTLVYRPAGDPVAPIQQTELKLPARETWQPGPVELFRFSAVTFNSHRIHYDLPYAQSGEGYPNLVVHGPFTAVRLLDYACRKAKRNAWTFSFRGIAPLFVSQPIHLSVGEDADTYMATRCDGVTAMTAKVEFK
jgi:3-methylfumaryl-CoA hydratase